MRYSRFGELPVWQSAVEVARQVYALTGKHRLRYTLRGQLERAALSISNDIAEGFERGTTQELLAFLYAARGSAGEVRSVLCVAEALTSDPGLRSTLSSLKAQVEGVPRQLHGWAAHLKESPLKGQRHLTKAVRAQPKPSTARPSDGAAQV
jgi:four helix bundle protein